ncbi:phage shock protein C (PspC) family protein [Frondihabitans australicus]|uniref:Phage shock protein C (PspC) family protein n=1 Tax=Frondihabitans australicus TaxID=386892 RepID=A0A495IIF8_9MICO|nr:phage shock protein C (PspC) family protein [Frondihabitans australicus]
MSVAEHLRWPVSVVRWTFVLLNLASGAGVLLYLWLWAMTPLRGTTEADGPVRRRVAVPLLLAWTAAAIALFSGAAVLAFGAVGTLAVTVPLTVALALGAVGWSRFVEPPNGAAAVGGALAVRISVGAGLVLLGFLLAVTSLSPGAGWLWLLVILVSLGVAAVAVGPEVLILRRQLSTQRIDRVRTEQRAEIAAHLHDSVLQTLALIQNRAGASSEVARIARAQERELRDWLYAGSSAPERDVASEIRDTAAALELDHSVRIDVVVVGMAQEPGQGAAELVAAAREAMLNAARHAGGDVSVYVEATSAAIDVFVRDRGPGFDVNEVPDDRLGVRESILGRMKRAGGTATVRRGAGGVGTEVHLHLDLAVIPAAGPGGSAGSPSSAPDPTGGAA